MTSQDMLFPILPRPTPPVNIHEIVEREQEIPQVEKKPETARVEEDKSELGGHQYQPEHHENSHEENQETEEVKDENKSDHEKDDDHPEHIDIFV